MNKDTDIRLNIQVPAKLRFKLKEIAAKRNVTLSSYIITLLLCAVELEEKYK